MTATIQAKAKATEEQKSSVAGMALKVTQEAIKLTSLTSKVLTQLTASSVQSEAQALDQAVSQLFGISVGETQTIDIQSKHWKPDGVSVTFQVPKNSDIVANDADFVSVGGWKIGFEAPRPSIFAEVTCPDTGCRDEDYARARGLANSSEILAFDLVVIPEKAGKLGSYLRQKDWYTASLNSFAAAVGNQQALTNAVLSFCNRIRQEAVDLKLSNLDASLVVKAVGEAMDLPPGARRTILGADGVAAPRECRS